MYCFSNWNCQKNKMYALVCACVCVPMCVWRDSKERQPFGWRTKWVYTNTSKLSRRLFYTSVQDLSQSVYNINSNTVNFDIS